MRADADRQPRDIFRDDVRPALKKSQALRSVKERQRPARADARLYIRSLPRRPDKGRYIADQVLRDLHLPRLAARQGDHFRTCDSRDIRFPSAGPVQPCERSLHDPALIFLVRKPYGQFHQKAVHLRLGKRERSPGLDRILGRDDEERIRQRTRDTVRRHLLLLHAFQKPRLRPRRRPVDLVREQDIGEDRSRPERKVPARLAVDGKARHIRRQKVRCELDPLVAAVHRSRERPRQRRFAGPRKVLEQHVPAGDERRQDQPRHVFASDHDLCDIVLDCQYLGAYGRAVFPDFHVRSFPPYYISPRFFISCLRLASSLLRRTSSRMRLRSPRSVCRGANLAFS